MTSTPTLRPSVNRLLVLALLAGLPAACVTPEPRNPFVGAWATTERQQVAFREDTVVLNPPNTPPTPMSAATCDGKFQFAYGRKSRDALLALVPRQRDITRKLTGMLNQPDYAVADATCGEGSTTYVLLDDRNVIAIHRDEGIAGVEQLTRT